MGIDIKRCKYVRIMYLSTLVLFASWLVMPLYATVIDTSKAWLPISQISKSYYNYISLDENHNGIVDYAESCLAENDTLQTVTDRGAITTNPITVGGLTSNGAIISTGDLQVEGNGEIAKNLTVSGGVLFVDNTTGRIGIGTRSAGRRVEIVANAGSYRPLRLRGNSSVGTVLEFAPSDSSVGTWELGTMGNGSSQGANKFVFVGCNSQDQGGDCNTGIMTLLPSGNVGIGTINPGLAGITGTYLSVAGDNNRGVLELIETRTGQGEGLHGGQILFLSSENTNPVISAIISEFASSGQDKGGRILFRTKQNSGPLLDAMIIDENQNVGIGTTNPQQKLTVVGDLNVTGTSHLNDLDVSGVTFLNGNIEAKNITLDNAVKSVSGKNLEFDAGDNGNVDVVITPSGNVGIGTGSPGAKLDIYGQQVKQEYSASWVSTEVSAYGGTAFFIGNRASGTKESPSIVNDGDRLVTFIGRGYDGSVFRSAAQVKIEVDGTPGASDMPGRIVFSTVPDGGTGFIDRMVIKNNGNVGIGTTNPGYKLDVNGSTRVQGNIYLSVDDHRMIDWGSGYGIKAKPGVLSISTGGNVGADVIDFKGGGVDSGTLWMRLGPGQKAYFSGNVGIGTTTPQAKLNVAGDANITAGGSSFVVSSSGDVVIYLDG